MVVVDHPGQAGLGAYGGGVTCRVVALGGELLCGRVVVEFLAAQVEDGLGGSATDQEFAVGVVEVVGGLGAFGELGKFSLDVPTEVLGDAGGAVALSGAALFVVSERFGGAAVDGDGGQGVGLPGAGGIDGGVAVAGLGVAGGLVLSLGVTQAAGLVAPAGPVRGRPAETSCRTGSDAVIGGRGPGFCQTAVAVVGEALGVLAVGVVGD